MKNIPFIMFIILLNVFVCRFDHVISFTKQKAVDYQYAEWKTFKDSLGFYQVEWRLK